MKSTASVVLFSYNQAAFVERAARSILDQDFEPLEVILSDDASSDETYEILARLAAEYKGPHSVVVNRNSRNLEIGAHVNRAVTLSKGQIIVMAAGDDFARRDRVRRLVEAMDAEDADGAFSDAKVLDITTGEVESLRHHVGREGRTWRDVLGGWVPVAGATAAWSRRLFEEYGPLADGCDWEDRALALRALLGKGLAFVPDQLVEYVKHGGNAYPSEKTVKRLSGDAYRALFVARMGTLASLAEDWTRSLRKAKTTGRGDISEATVAALEARKAVLRNAERWARGTWTFSDVFILRHARAAKLGAVKNLGEAMCMCFGGKAWNAWYDRRQNANFRRSGAASPLPEAGQ